MGESTPPAKLSAAADWICSARGPQKTAAADGVGRRLSGGPDASSLRTLQPASKDAAIKPRTSVLQGAGVRVLLPLKASDDGGSERDKEGEQG